MVAESVRIEGHFQHARRGGIPRRMTDATRYLCAAAYLDERFCRKVIGELVDAEHRAVVPSYGFDVGPVISHSLRARRLQLIRDVTIWALLIGSLLISPPALLTYFSLALPFAAVRLVPWRRFDWRRRFKIAWALAASYFIFWLLTQGLVLAWFILAGLASTNSSMTDGSPIVPANAEGQVALYLACTFLLGLAMLGIPFGWQVLVFRNMRTDLAPGTPTPPLDVLTERVRHHAQRLVDAQVGNVTLYSGGNPFLGSGAPDSPWARAWSIVVELDRPATPDGTPQAIDPVALHEHVRRRLMAMSEEWPTAEDDRPDRSDPRLRLPANERIAGLNIDYHVVARGVCTQYPRPSEPGGDLPDYAGHPLIDGSARVPYSKATEASRESIIRHPQGGVRCYQRVTVGAEGQAVRDAAGRIIAPAEDQDIVVSVFIYLAVEGHMLYAQFVADVLPPIRREYHLIDHLASCTDAALIGLAVRHRWLAALSDGVFAPFRVIRTLAQMAFARLRADQRPERFTAYDYGARLSVRELAAEDTLPTYLQVLDAHKYSRLIERRLHEAVLDHLQSHDIDVSAYRMQANQIIEQSVMINGGNYGPINTGSGTQDNRGMTTN
ncbi:hypothetical protein [Actinoallomurus soli]|uniref:hypothetical protein n=1 Tax=Actinoallomurus soli TaxID=2952535 RepID=UPI002093A385|nr:hypothetical protein [Actinoallomurus soli]MCO5968776.1 hypothetical protein [Actinoallomurus soli]